jgi:ribosomal protein S18 acetylase RimI-like enzyme
VVTIRRGVPDDAAAGAALHIACWQEGYADVVPSEVLAERTDDLAERTERWRTSLTDGPPRWLAVDDDGGLVGFAAAGPGRDDDIDLDLELYAIYVRAARFGTGLGHRLIEAAIGEAPAYLWVFEANDRAQGFYRRHGFTPDGSRKLEPSFREPEIRMVRR